MEKPEISEELRSRWGNAISDGFQAVPHRLFQHQAELGLSIAEMVVLLNLLDFWWRTERRPFPGTLTIAQRIGAKERTVRRHLSALQRKGFLVKRKQENGEKMEFDFTGLVHRLAEVVDPGPGVEA